MGRGGHGLLRIAHQIDPRLLREHPKPIVAFSDGTVLLATAARAGVTAIHGPVVTQLGRLPPEDHAALFALLESPEPGLLQGGLEALRPGRADGPLIGGNLEVFSRLARHDRSCPTSTARFCSSRKSASGRTASIACCAISSWPASSLGSPPSSSAIWSPATEPADSRVVSPTAERSGGASACGRLDLPVALGARIGHGTRNRALPYGVRVELDTRAGTLVALEGCGELT